MSERPKPVRCAVYTRKSTEHNLDLEFNSLHAQRESCEAYIKSQMDEGWQLIPDSYDDGGISGGSLDRPDLKRLITDIEAGRVDNVVVYKVDRLTRSLTDFARLVELFDHHGVSFVSVTQSFNTTSSMGRLTLNVLLSFAQFEREVIGERVRDKIAASKAKGLFMGGNIPLGYTNRDKKLVVVPEEAEQVRWLFQRYLELGSIGLLLTEMNNLGIRTRVTILSDGSRRGGGPFTKGPLAYLLKNRSYIREICHRGAIHAADHEPIIDRATFEAVQASLAAKTIVRKANPEPSDYLLTGLLYDSAGNRMTPSHSRKKGVRYRYYISQAILQSRKGDAGTVVRVPAPDIEAVVERFIRSRTNDPVRELKAILDEQVQKITIRSNALELVTFDSGAALKHQSASTICLPWFKKPFRAPKGVAEPSPALEDANKAKERLLTAIAKALQWVDQLTAGASLSDIAKREGKGERQLRFLMPFAFVPPQSLRDIIANRATVAGITAFAKPIPTVWNSGFCTKTAAK